MSDPTLPAILGGPKTINSGGNFVWPVITPETEKAVVDQLHTTVSIYDKSGIFAEFENTFAKDHDRRYALLSNSGTSAIFSMFEGIGLSSGDEVIAPVYTFHATISPAMYFGAIPVFCDTDESGNITLEEIKRKTTDKTKAVIVCHMWGVPVQDIVAIAAYCQDQGLYLLEDCSHAHGASIGGRRVGTFGDAAAWSLQGQKIITGGEGGIMVTDSEAIYTRALLQGHYNKRPKQEISPDNPLQKFFLTGMGLKLRAHPLAIAMAKQQYGLLDKYIAVKQSYANQMLNALKDVPFLTLPTQGDWQNSWYAFNVRYDQQKAFGVTRDRFAEALVAEGLVETDIPGSTGLLHELPLFILPNELLPRLYDKPIVEQTGFAVAQKVYESIVKFPVWATEDDAPIVEAYIAGILKVSKYIENHHEL